MLSSLRCKKKDDDGVNDSGICKMYASQFFISEDPSGDDTCLKDIYLKKMLEFNKRFSLSLKAKRFCCVGTLHNKLIKYRAF